MDEYSKVFSLEEDTEEELLPGIDEEELDENELELDEEELAPIAEEEEEL